MRFLCIFMKNSDIRYLKKCCIYTIMAFIKKEKYYADYI